MKHGEGAGGSALTPLFVNGRVSEQGTVSSLPCVFDRLVLHPACRCPGVARGSAIGPLAWGWLFSARGVVWCFVPQG